MDELEELKHELLTLDCTRIMVEGHKDMEIPHLEKTISTLRKIVKILENKE